MILDRNTWNQTDIYKQAIVIKYKYSFETI